MVSANLFPHYNTTSIASVLTSWHHVHDDSLVGADIILVVGILEGAAENAPVGSCVIEGDIEDVDGAIL